MNILLILLIFSILLALTFALLWGLEVPVPKPEDDTASAPFGYINDEFNTITQSDYDRTREIYKYMFAQTEVETPVTIKYEYSYYVDEQHHAESIYQYTLQSDMIKGVKRIQFFSQNDYTGKTFSDPNLPKDNNDNVLTKTKSAHFYNKVANNNIGLPGGVLPSSSKPSSIALDLCNILGCKGGSDFRYTATVSFTEYGSERKWVLNPVNEIDIAPEIYVLLFY